MSHYAKVLDGKVIQVIVAEPEFFNTFIDTTPGTYIQTSYNTRAGVHYGQDGNPDGGTALRGNYAGVGYIYDHVNDVFYPPQPYLSWTIAAPTWTWTPPTPKPNDGKSYYWDESLLQWTEAESNLI